MIFFLSGFSLNLTPFARYSAALSPFPVCMVLVSLNFSTCVGRCRNHAITQISLFPQFNKLCQNLLSLGGNIRLSERYTHMCIALREWLTACQGVSHSRLGRMVAAGRRRGSVMTDSNISSPPWPTTDECAKHHRCRSGYRGHIPRGHLSRGTRASPALRSVRGASRRALRRLRVCCVCTRPLSGLGGSFPRAAAGRPVPKRLAAVVGSAPLSVVVVVRVAWVAHAACSRGVKCLRSREGIRPRAFFLPSPRRGWQQTKRCSVPLEGRSPADAADGSPPGSARYAEHMACSSALVRLG